MEPDRASRGASPAIRPALSNPQRRGYWSWRAKSPAPVEAGPEIHPRSADAAADARTGKPGSGKSSGSPAAVARSIKVDTAKLDYLVDMVGEMVIAQSLVRHDPDLATGLKPRLARNLSQLARITDDVQRTAMSMRMIPIGQLFQKTARLVRDLSRKVGQASGTGVVRAKRPSSTATLSRNWPIR